ncbi:hypothetical protein PSYJA_40720, partial [Pseudomonas syringae pv. japonica str. M301072]
DDVPAWIEQQLLSRSYDLHLLLSPEGVDWISDGQRCQPPRWISSARGRCQDQPPSQATSQ